MNWQNKSSFPRTLHRAVNMSNMEGRKQQVYKSFVSLNQLIYLGNCIASLILMDERKMEKYLFRNSYCPTTLPI
jgi:hypothetical protein